MTFAKFLRTRFLKEHCQWLFLNHTSKTSLVLVMIINSHFLDPLTDAKGHPFNQLGGGGKFTRFWWGVRQTGSQPTNRFSILWRSRYVNKIIIYFRQNRYID